MTLTVQLFERVIDRLRADGWADEDIQWSENVQPPASADEFASEAIFVICNSGMNNVVACRIYRKVMDALKGNASARTVFGHPGKAGAIDAIWKERARLYAGYHSATDKLAFCESLPWIGGITKFHLAKNFGADVAKPDVHLNRLAELCGETPQGLCERLGQATGLRAATVDLLLWRACATGVLQPKSGGLSL